MNNKILVVDDEVKIVELMARILSKNNYDVLKAEGGQKALEVISTIKDIDLVLCDLKMPVVDGVDVLKECIKRNIKVLILTASININRFDSQLKELNYNLDEVLQKPIDINKLVEAIKKKLAV